MLISSSAYQRCVVSACRNSYVCDSDVEKEILQFMVGITSEGINYCLYFGLLSTIL